MIRNTRNLFLLIAVLAVSAYGFGKPPAWLSAAASTKVGTYEKDVPGVVLHNEQIVTVDEKGKIVTVDRYAVKVLTREGRGLAVARAYYLASAGKVGELKAWTLSRSGASKDYGKKQTVDIISDPDDVYNEGRIKLIDASDDVRIGDVFGYTVKIENPPLFYQDVWHFQARLPVVLSRYTLNLPTGWQASALVFNHDGIAPKVNGSSYTWQVGNLQPIKPEPMSPSIKDLAPFMAVNFAPPSGEEANRTFASWQDVSRWATGIYDAKVVINDEIAAKARELTADAKTELDKIKAIGKFVQNLQYISIDIGVAYGNGYKPRASDTVFSRGYGDCKDKATLMRAMLQALKIESYPVVIYAGDPNFVRKEWASPRQFNHCIIAVSVSPDTTAPTVIENEKLGRLLVFDATDDMTPVGDLPETLQGSYGLVMAGDDGDLLEMPLTGVEDNVMVRTVAVKLAGDGSISGSIAEQTKGQSSRYERSLFRSLSASEYQKSIESWLSRGATAAKLEDISMQDDHDNAEFDLRVQFSAPSYGQLMQGRLLIFKPAIVNRSTSIYLTDKERETPVRMDSTAFEESAVFELPSGFSVDEMPDPLNLKTSFGEYETSYKVEEGKLVFSRKMILNRTTIPVDKYDAVRGFFTKILSAENSPVVLIKD